eukprot:COSAG01_NODE_35311_length_533_cov_31.034562_1_plen_49_part_10
MEMLKKDLRVKAKEIGKVIKSDPKKAEVMKAEVAAAKKQMQGKEKEAET